MTIDELKPYGIEEMREEQIRNFLETQSIGILGLPTGGAPYLIPLSYGFDGNDSLYFVYVLGAQSRKKRFTEAADSARFLVYSADTPFIWESVLLTGTIETVRPSKWGEITPLFEDSWRPDIFQRGETDNNVELREFRVSNFAGIKHTQLPSE